MSSVSSDAAPELREAYVEEEEDDDDDVMML